MSQPFSSQPIATVDQFKTALLALRDKGLADSHLTMLKAQCRSPEGTITATKLAEAADYQNYNAANLRYGLLAREMAEQLGYLPISGKDGAPMWWSTLSYAIEGAGEPGTGQFQFIMRPELTEALRTMRWA